MVASSDFVGMHPQLRQVPPSSALSTSTTSAPRCAPRSAATSPAGPPPSTTTRVLTAATSATLGAARGAIAGAAPVAPSSSGHRRGERPDAAVGRLAGPPVAGVRPAPLTARWAWRRAQPRPACRSRAGQVRLDRGRGQERRAQDALLLDDVGAVVPLGGRGPARPADVLPAHLVGTVPADAALHVRPGAHVLRLLLDPEGLLQVGVDAEQLQDLGRAGAGRGGPPGRSARSSA